MAATIPCSLHAQSYFSCVFRLCLRKQILNVPKPDVSDILEIWHLFITTECYNDGSRTGGGDDFQLSQIYIRTHVYEKNLVNHEHAQTIVSGPSLPLCCVTERGTELD